MKVFVVFVAIAAIVAVKASTLSEEQKAKLKANNEACIKEIGVDMVKVQHVRQGDFSDRDDKLNGYVFCMFKRSDLIADDGIFKKDVAMSKLPADADRVKVEQAIDACVGEKGANPQESAFMMFKCYHEKKPDHAML